MKNFHLLMRIVVLIFLISFTQEMMAQQTVTGTVMDGTTDQPLIGATVQVKGTSTGVVTDLNGNYTIAASPDDALVFSYVGYINEEVEVGSKTEINVTLEESFESIQELVVIGYGTVKKDDLTGSVSVVTPEELNRTPAPTIDRALQGRAAGVVVNQTGVPGKGVQVRIRGIGSISRDPNPLYVIDGVMTGNMNSINPADIESIQILKDASATAIYGADGSNGVIIINTKRGESGAPQVTFNATANVGLLPNKFELMNADQYADFYNEFNEIQGEGQEVAYTDRFRQLYYGDGWQEGTDWQDEIIQQAYSQNYYLGVSGGSERSNFSISASYYDEQGLLMNSWAKRYTLRANSDFTINDYIKVGESINISRIEYRNAGYGGWDAALISSPLSLVNNDDLLAGYEGHQVPYQIIDPENPSDTLNALNTGGNDKFNPRGQIGVRENREWNTDLLLSLYAEITPFDWLTFKTTPSIDAGFSRDNDWTRSYDMGARIQPLATLYEQNNRGEMLSLENQLTFAETFGEHSITLTGVHHVRASNNVTMNADAEGFEFENLRTLSNATTINTVNSYLNEFRSISYLGRLIYDYAGKYLVTASIRRDGVSRFGQGNRWGTFPSFSLGWKLNEDLLPNVDQIDMLKLRFGWGQVGNSNIGNYRYSSFLAQYNDFAPVFGVGQIHGRALNILNSTGNPLIKWEASATTNFGIDLNMYGNKFTLSAEYYIKQVDDLLVKTLTSQAWGVNTDPRGGGQPWANLGSLENRGFEFTSSYRKMEGVFNYEVNATFTTIKNEVIDIPEAITDRPDNITRIGNTVGSLYGYVAERILTPEDYDEDGNLLYAAPVGVNPQPGDLLFKDLNQDGVITPDDRTIIGKAIPDFTYSLNINLYYKAFDMGVFLYGNQNFELLNQNYATIATIDDQDNDHNKLLAYAQNYYREDRPSTEFVRADPLDVNENNRTSTWWVEDASFLRLKDIQLGFTIPESTSQRVGISRARVFLNTTNLFTFTKYKGRDPEAPMNSSLPLSPGIDNNSYPLPRTFGGGVQLTF